MVVGMDLVWRFIVGQSCYEEAQKKASCSLNHRTSKEVTMSRPELGPVGTPSLYFNVLMAACVKNKIRAPCAKDAFNAVSDISTIILKQVV